MNGRTTLEDCNVSIDKKMSFRFDWGLLKSHEEWKSRHEFGVKGYRDKMESRSRRNVGDGE
jgi:hypothetical protein